MRGDLTRGPESPVAPPESPVDRDSVFSLSVKSAPLSVSPMRVGGSRAVKLELAGQYVNSEGQALARQPEGTLNRVLWNCEAEMDVNGTPQVVSNRCGRGPAANIDLTGLVDNSRRRSSQLVKLNVTASLDGRVLGRVRREVFLDSRLSKLQSCFGGSAQDQEAARDAEAKAYADFADATLQSNVEVPATFLTREGPIMRVTFDSTHDVPAFSTVRDIVRSGKYFVLLRSYAPSVDADACRLRGVATGARGSRAYASALVFDASGRYMLVSKSNTGTLSAVADGTQAARVINYIEESMPVAHGHYGDLGSSEIAAWLSNRRASHLVLGLNQNSVRDILDR
jgi:hypothetical protein